MITNQNQKRIILWAIVIMCTAALPYVVLVFNMITRHSSAGTAGDIPLFIIIFLAAAYTLICFRLDKFSRCIGILAIGAIIVAGIMAFEENANKYIHFFTGIVGLDQVSIRPRWMKTSLITIRQLCSG